MANFLIRNMGISNNSELYNIIKNDSTNTIFITNPNLVIKTKMDINELALSPNVKVYDLKSLVLKIYREYIHKLEIINSDKQRILFLKAIIEVNSKLKVLKDYYEEIIDEIIDIYNKEKKLRLKKSDYRNSKIDDINLIIETYLELIEDKYIDEVQVYEEVNDFLKDNFIYQDYNIYINDLYYFDNTERELIISLLRYSKNSYIVFPINKEINGLEILFNNYQYFISNLDSVHFIDNNLEYSYKDFLVDNLYSFNEVKYEDNIPIGLYGASDPYDEIIFIANQIEKMRNLYNYNYRDFMIVANNTTDYERFIDLIFKDNNIPYHQKQIINSNFAQFINLVLDIINGDLKNKTILKLLKFSYFNISLEDIEKLNQYIFINNLEDSNFDINDENIEEEIRLFINNSILMPLTAFKEILNIKEFLVKLYYYLTENDLIGKINIESWNYMMQVFDNINYFLGDKPLNINLLKRIISYYTDKAIIEENYTNEVLFGNSDTLIGYKPKVVFFIGMNEGIVPKISSDNLLINSKLAQQYYFDYPVINDILINKFKTLYFINCAQEYTYLSYSKINNAGGLINPSIIVKKINKLFPKLNIINKNNIEEFINLENLVFNQYALFNNKQYFNLLNQYFLNSNKYQSFFDKINYFNNFYDIKPLLINKEKSLYLSASRIDKYVQCPFQYFCQYVLNLKPIERQKYDNRLVGTYIHYLLEKLINNKSNDIEQLLYDSKQQFIKDNILSISPIINYFLDRLNNNIKVLWPIIKKELDNNKFVPQYLELDISKSEKWHPLIISDNNLTIKLSGIIDRIDVYDKYYRIIDYKTGDKKINLNELVVGLNLQLFIYLLFAYNNLKDHIGAGIFYMPVYYSFNNGEDKNYRLTGMFLNNDEVISALGGNDINQYVDAYRNNKFKDSVLYDNEQLIKLVNFTKQKIIEIGNKINNGDFRIDPIKNTNSCDYCSYKAICGIEKNTKIGHYLEKYELSDIWKIVGGESND